MPFASYAEPRLSDAARRHTIPPSPFCETFPNDGDLATTPQDQPWNAFDGTISGGKLADAPFADGRMEVDAGSTDMFVEADLNADIGYVYLVARCGDDTDLYADEGIYLFVDSTPFDTYFEIGNWGGGGAFAWDDPAGDLIEGTWRLEVTGNTARALRNGVEMLTADVSSSPAAGQRGGFEYGSTSQAVNTTYTVTESFNKADGTSIGPDRNWTKWGFDDSVLTYPPGFTDDGVIISNRLGLQSHDGHNGGAQDGFATVQLIDSNPDTEFSLSFDAYIQVRLVAQSVVGAGDHYTFVYLGWRTLAYFAMFRNVPNPGGGQFLQLDAFGDTTTPTAFAAGDILRVEYDAGANEIRGLVNGVVIATLTANFASILEPHVAMEVGSGSTMIPFTWAGQDLLDEYEAHGTVQSTVYPGTMDNFCVGPA